MDNLSRRRFFQVAGGALGAIGLNQLTLAHRANTYGRVLAQSTPRRVALLIGINDYSRNKLGGAVNDVELQKQLLIHRFGFNPADVHTLKNEQASRRDILGAFNEYLYEPAQSGDVVVFHFSGHGDHVLESDLMRDFTNRLGRNCIDDQGEFKICRNTAIAPFRYDEQGTDAVQDIMGHTLLLMRTALAQKTDNITFVLDCCYAGGGKRGNAVMRSLDSSAASQTTRITPRISDTEWEYQQSWLERLNLSEADFVRAIQSSTGPGFFAGAAGPRQYAADYPFNGFVAGAFTYLLTQHLWQTTSPLSTTISTLSSSLSRLQNHDQTPEYEPDLSTARSLLNKTIYHIPPDSLPAEAVVLGPKAGDRNRFHLWLGGLDPQRLAAFDQGAIFSIIDQHTGESLGEMRQVEGTRDGLQAEGERVDSGLKQTSEDFTSHLLQERTRSIPDSVVLKIALDDTLTAAEQAQAIALLSTTNFEVSSAEVGKVAHALLGRYTEVIAQQLIPDSTGTLPIPALNSIGIFSPTQVPVLANSFGPAGESIEAAVERLRSRFVSLHIGRMLALMVNGRSSQIDVEVAIQSAGSRQGTTTRGGNPEAILIPQQSDQRIEPIPLGNKIDVIVTNHEASALHFGLLAIDSAGDISVLFPPTSDDPTIDLIRSNESKTESLVAVEPLGTVELLILASPQSLVGPLETLRDRAARIADPTRGDPTVDAAEAVSGIFGAMSTPPGDVTTKRQSDNKQADSGDRTVKQLLDVEEVAVLSMLFKIVP